MLKPFWVKKRKIGLTGEELAVLLSKINALPDITEADSGKVLSVNEEGEWELITPIS